MLKALTALMYILSVLAAVAGTGSRARAEVTIFRDDYGVPHIFSDLQEGVFYGFGYVQAEDNLHGIILNYLTATGTLSDTFGLSNDNFENDYSLKLLRVPQHSIEKYDQILLETKQEMIEPFVAGINTYIDEHKSELPSWILDNAPVTPIEVVAMASLVFLRFAPETSLTHDLELGQTLLLEYGPDEYANLYNPVVDNPAVSTTPKLNFSVPEIGSNQWAVSPEKSVTGHAMYGLDPHVPWDGLYQWCEAHLHGPKIDIYGSTFFGLPFIMVGHNEYFAWSETVNQPDLADVWVEKLNPNNPLQYLYEGDYLNMTEVSGRIGGNLVTMLYTHHGAVFTHNTAEGYALAVNYSSSGVVGELTQFYHMNMATNLAEFKAAMEMLAVPQFNTMYADIYGNVFYVWNARCPLRSQDYRWDYPVPGWTNTTEWLGFMPFDNLPQEQNPDSGWMQNCNVPPWNITSNSIIEFGEFPQYLTPLTRISEYSRGRRLTHLLAESERIAFEEMKKIALDVYVSLADSVMPLVPDPSPYTGELKKALEILKAWDRYATKDSTAMTIFMYLFEEYEKYDVETPSLQMLKDSIERMLTLYGTIEVPWGTVNALSRGDEIFPLSGGPSAFGILHSVHGPWINGVWRCNSGSSFIMVVNLEPNNITAYSLLPYGESNNPSSPHYDDQAQLYSEDTLKPAWFYLEDIENHVESIEVLDTPYGLLGDLDNNGVVDIMDISIVANAFGSTPEDSNWNQIADLNNDDVINILDVATVAKEFGKTA